MDLQGVCAVESLHVTDKKNSILSIQMAQLLAISALSGSEKVIAKALKKINYYLRSNYYAYESHKRKRLKSRRLDCT